MNLLKFIVQYLHCERSLPAKLSLVDIKNLFVCNLVSLN